MRVQLTWNEDGEHRTSESCLTARAALVMASVEFWMYQPGTVRGTAAALSQLDELVRRPWRQAWCVVEDAAATR